MIEQARFTFVKHTLHATHKKIRHVLAGFRGVICVGAAPTPQGRTYGPRHLPSTAAT